MDHTPPHRGRVEVVSENIWGEKRLALPHTSIGPNFQDRLNELVDD